jgi:LysR family nitrogen assimilation transcriptional regulator
MNLKQLIYFRKAIETGNITRAASELHVAQTALGIQIRNLEEELGVELLERHSRGVRATPSGELLNTYAEDILARLEEMKRAVRARAGAAQETLLLGVTPSIVRLVGDAILTEFAQMLPGVELHIVEDFSFILMRQLEQGELACALTYSPDSDPRFQRRALLEEELFLMTANDSGETGPVAFRDAVGRELALTGKQDVVARALSDMADRLGVTVNVAYQVQSIRAVKNLVAKGVAATVMPYGAAESELRKNEFRARHIVSPPVVRTLVAITPRDPVGAGIPQGFDAFVDAIADRLHAAEGPITRRL